MLCFNKQVLMANQSQRNSHFAMLRSTDLNRKNFPGKLIFKIYFWRLGRHTKYCLFVSSLSQSTQLHSHISTNSETIPRQHPTMQNPSNRDLNRQRFAMRGQGFALPTSMIAMNKAIQMSCKNKDIVSTTFNAGFIVDHVVDPPAGDNVYRSAKFVSELRRASVIAGFTLLPIQATAVSRIVRRPSSTTTISRLQPYQETKVYRTPISDVLSPVILDMPTGTGKTITALLGAILFAIERNQDMQQQLQVSPTVTGVSDVTGSFGWDPSASPITRNCMFLTPRHLYQHGLNHACTAKKIVEGMTFSDGRQWTVRVVTNKRASTLTMEPNEVVVIICDASRCGAKKYLERSVHYASICFDEAGERDGKVNALCQIMVPNIKHGRIILVSADFSKWRHHFEPRTSSVFRHVFPQWDSYNITHAAAAACRSAAVFDRLERTSVMLECTDALKSAVLDMACVRYRPSLLERVGGGYGAELGDDRGCDLFRRKHGVDVSACLTIDDITAAIKGVIDKHGAACRVPGVSRPEQIKLSEKINKLQEVTNKIRGVLSEDCPICLERKQDLTLIQPCLHFTCKSCLSQWTSSCPMCRGEMRGTVGVTTEQRTAKKTRVSEAARDVRIGGLFFDEMGTLCGPSEPAGVMQAIENTLMAIQTARSKPNRAGRTFRTMLICPGSSMREGLFADLGFDVMHYKTVGTKDDVVTIKRLNTLMNKFKADDGYSKLLCVRDAGEDCKQDCMTGLDIPNLDCVVSIGGFNLAQRMGRLCRLSRMSLPDKEKHGLYVDIVPTWH